MESYNIAGKFDVQGCFGRFMRVAKSAFGILCHLVMRAAFGGLDPKLTLAAAGSKALFGPFTSSKVSK